jgi:hypothetical protein
MDTLTPRQRYLRRYQALKNERSSWVEHWRDLCDYIQPRRSRFLTDPKNAGQKKNQHIINSVATWASRTLASGMMAGITSPARPWFRLTTPDPDLAEYGAVKDWLFVCEERIRLAFQRSNIYNALHQVYADLGTPGTATMIVEEDAEDLIRGYVLPIGSYALQNSARLRVDSVYREMSMTAGQMVEQFSLERCSDSVRTAYESGQVDQHFTVIHIIEPNRDAKRGRAGPEGMPVRSCWVEAGAGDEQRPLKESGFEEFPAMCPRWTVTGEDVYGSSPAMDALGDIRAASSLGEEEGADGGEDCRPTDARTQVADEYAHESPPGRHHLRRQPRATPDICPGDGDSAGSHCRRRGGNKRARGANQNGLLRGLVAFPHARRRGADDRERSVERHEEKMLQLGPVMERLTDELLDPLIDRTFAILLRSGDLPPPPEELQGVELRVEYLSILAQAQKLVGTSAVERLASFVGNLAGVRPEVLDKVNFDEMVNHYGDMLGVPPKLIRPDDEVASMRQQRAQQQQAAEQAQAAAQSVQGAKVLSETDTGSDNALTRIMSNMGGAVPAGRA